MAIRRSNRRGKFDSSNIDQRMNQFIDAGRQFVDGVSGTRPGKRRNSNFQEFSRRNAKNVGKWVSDKVDSLFEDEYESDWDDDNIVGGKDNFKTFSRHQFSEVRQSPRKRPLQSISLRESVDVDQDQEPKKLLRGSDFSDDDWPEDSDFHVNRWQRPPDKRQYSRVENSFESQEGAKNRNLPRSRRRRR